MTKLEVVQSVVSNHEQVRAKIENKVLNIVAATWQNLGSYNERDVATLVNRVTPLVEAGKLQIANLTDVYVAQSLSAIHGNIVKPTGVRATDVAELRGISPDEEFRRPFIEQWAELAAGTLWATANQRGQNRLLSLVGEDMGLAFRYQARRSLRANGVKNYRRVANIGACPLCALASQQTYHIAELLPIHKSCRCSVLPVYSSSDFANALNSTAILDMPQGSVDVYSDDELGPMLRAA